MSEIKIRKLYCINNIGNSRDLIIMFVKGFGAARSGKKRQPCGVPALTKAWVPTGLSSFLVSEGK